MASDRTKVTGSSSLQEIRDAAMQIQLGTPEADDVLADCVIALADRIDEIDNAAVEQMVPVPLTPWVTLPDLPDDMADAYESYKLALLRHGMEGWHWISREDAIAALQSLIRLAQQEPN